MLWIRKFSNNSSLFLWLKSEVWLKMLVMFFTNIWYYSFHLNEKHSSIVYIIKNRKRWFKTKTWELVKSGYRDCTKCYSYAFLYSIWTIKQKSRFLVIYRKDPIMHLAAIKCLLPISALVKLSSKCPAPFKRPLPLSSYLNKLGP